MATELELKLMVHPAYFDKAIRFLDALCLHSGPATRQPTLKLMNGYYDTAAGLLMSSGIALRIRSVNQEYIQTLKTRGVSRVGMHARGEWEWYLPTDTIDFDLITHDMLPTSLQNQQWQANVNIVYRTDFERQIWLIDDGDSVIEAVCDKGEVTSPYGRDDICEIEFELKQGDEKALYDVALSLANAVPVQVCTVSKAQRGVRLKCPVIELPETFSEGAQDFEIGAYWYEVWLTYWEAMLHRQDAALFEKVQDSLINLQRYLPHDLSVELETVLNRPVTEESPTTPLYLQLSRQTKVGVCMLKIARWLNLQHSK
ncbi:CYTH domain-containing protein [Marinomonas algicola]|uniref:CYTH domain-containing protein n=1 Tax=Marinomonas algicola TaxID=2773454 RepID=UPI00174E9F49|nr:CYTH domain-containing protein [Marinomonas algicola]